MRAILAVFLVVGPLTLPAGAQPPDVQALVARMKAAIEPSRPGARRVTLTLSQDQETVQVTLGEARKTIDGRACILFTTLAPASAQGTSYLVQEGGPGPETEWFYLPYVRRVRKLVSPEAYSAFLNSDFTYADLGFVDTGATYTLLGEGTDGGVRTYQIQAVPKETWYYARWITTINAETAMPIMREIYDSANVLWKQQRFADLTVVDGVTLPGLVSMEDLQAKSRTDIRLAGADYDVTLPDALFAPKNLPDAAAAHVWTSVGK